MTRQAAADWARELLGQPLVVLDTETTGFGSQDEIVQIGIIDADGEPVLSTLVKPTVPIPNSHIHGITDEMVAAAPSFPEVHARLSAALLDRMVLAYNFAFDSRMIEASCRLHQLPGITYQGACIMELYAHFYGERNKRYGDYKWQKLSKAVADLGLAVEGRSHDTLSDCRAALAVLKKMAEYG